MHIAVCVKHVPDPETAWIQFRLDEIARTVAPLAGVPWVMSPFDEQALEAALRVREAVGSARITVMTLGGEPARAVLKHGLAMGADDGVLLCDPAFDDGDAWTTATVLAAAVRRLGSPSLVLAGRQAADWDAGVVGSMVAELLDWPVITFAADVAVAGGTVRVERVVEDGLDIVEAGLPAVVTVSNELGRARTPNLRETMRAARKPVAVWGAAELGLSAAQVGSAGARSARERLFAPDREQRCELMPGEGAAEQARRLVERLRAARVI